MRHRMHTDCVTALDDLAEHFGVAGCELAYREKRGLHALGGKRGQDGFGVCGERTIVEGEDNLLRIEEVICLVVLKAEAGSARGVDFHHARHAKRVIVAGTGPLRNRRCGRAHSCLPRFWVLRLGSGVKSVWGAEDDGADQSCCQYCTHCSSPRLP